MVLSTEIDQPIFSIIIFTIGSHNPVPVISLVVLFLIWMNLSKILPIFFSSIPIPVSVIVVMIEFSFIKEAICISPPCGVNLIAFPMRLTKICRNFPGSRSAMIFS